MRAALTVVPEFLRCRLMESGRDALLECVAELLDAAASGAPPFCYLLPSRAAIGPHDGPGCNDAPSGAPGGFIDTRMVGGARGPIAPTPPPTGTSVAPHGPGEAPRYHS